MPAIDYNINTPSGGNVPLQDIAKMQTNTNSINTFLNTDHYTFSSENAGWHKQLTLAGNNVPGTQSGLISTLYSNAGTASSSSSQLFFRNSLGGASAAYYHLNPIKAWAYCSGTVASPTNSVINSQSSGVTEVVRSATGVYTVTMPANTVASSSYAVLVSSTLTPGSTPVDPMYAISSATSFTITTYVEGVPQNVTGFSFSVMQI